MQINWRLASRLSVITLAILVVILVTIIQQQQQKAQPQNPAPIQNSGGDLVDSKGTTLDKTPAPDFHLTDQSGKAISLSQFKGQPVVLTFLYTSCPDQCPLIATKLHQTLQDLGTNGQQVGILAVSVDPQHDNAAAAMRFSQAHNMQDYWHFLIGKREQLAPVWSAYHIYAAPGQPQGHGIGVFLIDKQGQERLFLKEDFDPQQLSKDLQQLLKE